MYSYINIYMCENFEITAWFPSLGLIISENAKYFRVLLEIWKNYKKRGKKFVADISASVTERVKYS